MRKIIKWTKKEEDYLRENYANSLMGKMTKKLKCSRNRIYYSAQVLGLKRLQREKLNKIKIKTCEYCNKKRDINPQKVTEKIVNFLTH
jgi:hypothetical protein